MKVLILSASIGSGHMQAADAIVEAFENQQSAKVTQVQIIDFMDKKIAAFNWLLKKIYLSILGLVPDLYDRIYKIAGIRRFGSITRLIWSTLMYLPFSRLLKIFEPDVIICTHPFPAAAAALWKFLHPQNASSFTLATILTDFSLHEIWIYSEVDIYFVATNDMKSQLESHGNYKVIASGIPIRQQFIQNLQATKNNSSPTVQNLQATENNSSPIILIMGGGLGLGDFENTLKALENLKTHLKIIVITGKNHRLKSKLQSLNSKHELIICGFVNDIAPLMSSADVLISKPGGLTLAESFSIGLPLLLLPPIPGPEALNAHFAIKNGAAVSIDENSAALDILFDANRITSMKKAALSLAKPNAAFDIVRFLMKFEK